VFIALVLVALILSIIEVVRSHMASLIAWAGVALSVALLLGPLFHVHVK